MSAIRYFVRFLDKRFRDFPETFHTDIMKERLLMETYKAKMDIRGFIRFTRELAEKFKLKNTPYANVSIDTAGNRIAIVPTAKLKPTSFRLLPSNETFLLYLRGAMKAVGIPVVSGEIAIMREGDRFVFQKKNPRKTGEWKIYACRNSAGLPMISIDPRGTMILDKRCITALDTRKNNAMTPEYDAKKKMFRFTFGKKGLLNVRTIDSHASLSMMGTFHAFGVKLPDVHTRVSVKISGNIMTFRIG